MKSAIIKMKEGAVKLLALLLVMAAPAVSYCQPPEPEDGNPDVPFDNNMNIMFLIIGVVFAGIIVWQEWRKRRRLQGSDVK